MKPKLPSSPHDGDIVLLCDRSHNQRHVFSIENGAGFTRPDGTRAIARWMGLCDQCFAVYMSGEEKMEELIRADGIWMGDEPLSYQESN